MSKNNEKYEKVAIEIITEPEAKLNPAPDGGYAWVILISAFLVSFILDGLMYSFGVILQPIRENYNETNERANLLSSLNTGFLFSSGPIASGLSNQFGCRSVVMGGGLITGLMYYLSIYAPNINIMMISYGVIGGLSTGVTYISSLIIIAEYFDKKRGIATGLTMAGSGVGAFVFAPVIQKIIEKLDWKFTMLICACVITQTCVCGALLRPLNPKVATKKSIKKDSDDENEEKSIVQTMSASCKKNSCFILTTGLIKETFNFKLVFQDWRFFLILLSNFFLFIGYFTPFLFIPKIAKDNNIPNGSFILSIIGIVNIPFRILFGLLADQGFISAINLNTLSIAIAAAPLFIYSYLQYQFWTQAIFAVVFGIGMAGFNCLTTMYLVELVGVEKFSNATGIISLFRGFACFIGPFLGGYIADKYGMINSFYFSGICFSAGFILALFVSFGTVIRTCMQKRKQKRFKDVELRFLNK